LKYICNPSLQQTNCSVDIRATSGLIPLTEGITIINGNRDRGIHTNKHDSPNGDKATMKKGTGKVANRRETKKFRRGRADAAVCSKAHPAERNYCVTHRELLAIVKTL
jgi:hypothetical protein